MTGRAAPGAAGASGARRPGGRRAGRSGRRPRAGDTRGAILGAARAAFAEAGFDGATIRGIAARAGVDPALVHHYFGSKQRLFIAAMELPVDPAAVAPALLAGDPASVGARLVRFVLGLWDDPATRPVMLGIVRSAASDPVAAAMLREILAAGPFAAIVRAVTTEEPYAAVVGPLGRADAELRATLVGTQLIGLLMGRAVVGVEPLASAPAEVIVAAVGPTIQRYLVGDLG